MPYRVVGLSKIFGYVGSLGVGTFSITVAYDIVKKSYHSCLLTRARRLSTWNPDAPNGNGSSMDNSTLGIRIAIYIELLTLLTHMVVVVMSFLLITNEHQCRAITPIHFLLFHFSGALLYLILVRRVQLIYSNTLFKLPSYHIFNLYAGIALYSMPYLIYVDWFLIETRFDPEFGCVLYPLSLSSLLLALTIILHTLVAIYSLYLFVSPIHHLIQQQDSFCSARVSGKLYLVMIKYSILYSCSIFSSLILLVLSMTSPIGYTYSLISSFVNGIVLILLHPIQNKLYKNLCCCAHALCALLWRAPRELVNIKRVTSQGVVIGTQDHLANYQLATNSNKKKNQYNLNHPNSKENEPNNICTGINAVDPRLSKSNHSTKSIHRKSKSISDHIQELAINTKDPCISTTIRLSPKKSDTNSNLEMVSVASYANQTRNSVHITSLKSPKSTIRSPTLEIPPLISTDTPPPMAMGMGLMSTMATSRTNISSNKLSKIDLNLNTEIKIDITNITSPSPCPCPLQLEMNSPPLFLRGPSTSLAMECGLSPRSVAAEPINTTIAPLSPPVTSATSPGDGDGGHHGAGALRRLSNSACEFSKSINQDINSEIAIQKKSNLNSAALKATKSNPMMSITVEPSLPNVMESVEEEQLSSQHSTQFGGPSRSSQMGNVLCNVDVEALWNSTHRSFADQQASMGGLQFLVSLKSITSTKLSQKMTTRTTMRSKNSRSTVWTKTQSSSEQSTSWKNLDSDVAMSFQESVIRTIRLIDNESSFF